MTPKESTPGDTTDDPVNPTPTASKGPIRVIVIFDTDHDGDLYERLRVQSSEPGCEFRVMGGSESTSDTPAWRDRMQQRMAEADQVIVICGEHTEASPRIHTELVAAQSEETPYFLLWGRREIMCTKPVGAKSADGMYSWTRQVLHDQMTLHLRKVDMDAKARSLRRVVPDSREPA